MRNEKGASHTGRSPRRRLFQSALRTPRSALSLVEILVVATVIAVLTAMLGSTLKKVRHATQSYLCKNKLKTVAFEFGLFADDYGHGDRGDSEEFRGKGFRIGDFQDKLYRVDEFWELGTLQSLNYAGSRQPLMCPTGPQQLQAQAGYPCDAAVNPQENVSIVMNKRLERASVPLATGGWTLKEVRLNARILERPSTPLAFDGDGGAAARRRRLPFYMAPPAGDPGHYGNGQFWYPAFRHLGEINSAFVGGHVAASRDPLSEPGWGWEYQPPINP